jgi:carboxyl-terminal processing protease
VDGQRVLQWSLYEVVGRIRGPRGSTVRVEVQHLEASDSLVLEIKRGVIGLRSVFWNMTNDSLAYVRLGAFYGNTDEALKIALQDLLQRGARGIVLDLRNNPGGFLSTSVAATSYFLAEGLVTYEVNGRGKRTDHPVRPGGPAKEVPLVVLVNQFSASGSEVMVGALQDYGRAPLVGARTFGKGSVNLLRPLSDGGGLYVTSARWYTPKGRLIEGRGLEPDVAVAPVMGQQGDAQLEKALELLRGRARPSPSN